LEKKTFRKPLVTVGGGTRQGEKKFARRDGCAGGGKKGTGCGGEGGKAAGREAMRTQRQNTKRFGVGKKSGFEKKTPEGETLGGGTS